MTTIEETGCFYILEVFLSGYFTTTKRKTVTEEQVNKDKLNRHHLNQMIKTSIVSNEAY